MAGGRLQKPKNDEVEGYFFGVLTTLRIQTQPYGPCVISLVLCPSGAREKVVGLDFAQVILDHQPRRVKNSCATQQVHYLDKYGMA